MEERDRVTRQMCSWVSAHPPGVDEVTPSRARSLMAALTTAVDAKRVPRSTAFEDACAVDSNVESAGKLLNVKLEVLEVHPRRIAVPFLRLEPFPVPSSAR